MLQTRGYAIEEKRAMKAGHPLNVPPISKSRSPEATCVIISNGSDNDNEELPDLTYDRLFRAKRIQTSCPEVNKSCKDRSVSVDKTRNTVFKKGPGSKKSKPKCKDMSVSESGESINAELSKLNLQFPDERERDVGKFESISDMSKVSERDDDRKNFPDLYEDLENDDSTGNKDSDWYSSQSTMKKKRKQPDSNMLQIMQERSKLMEKMTESVVTFTQSAIRGEGSSVESADVLWSKSLVLLMGRMQQDIKDKFMVYVYKIAMEAIQGKLPDDV